MTGIDLAVRRIRARLRQWQVAAELGYSGAWLSQLERGEKPLRPDVAQRISETIEEMSR